MQEYPIKRGNTKEFQDRMVEGLIRFFETEPAEKEGHYVISYGILGRLEVFAGEKGKTLVVDTESDMTIDDDAVIIDTNSRFRKYLEYVTGYTAKERAKKAQKID
jgi:hypothetical protein